MLKMLEAFGHAVFLLTNRYIVIIKFFVNHYALLFVIHEKLYYHNTFIFINIFLLLCYICIHDNPFLKNKEINGNIKRKKRGSATNIELDPTSFINNLFRPVVGTRKNIYFDFTRKKDFAREKSSHFDLPDFLCE
jgi:hypothetical protein